MNYNLQSGYFYFLFLMLPRSTTTTHICFHYQLQTKANQNHCHTLTACLLNLHKLSKEACPFYELELRFFSLRGPYTSRTCTQSVMPPLPQKNSSFKLGHLQCRKNHESSGFVVQKDSVHPSSLYPSLHVLKTTVVDGSGKNSLIE